MPRSIINDCVNTALHCFLSVMKFSLGCQQWNSVSQSCIGRKYVMVMNHTSVSILTRVTVIMVSSDTGIYSVLWSVQWVSETTEEGVTSDYISVINKTLVIDRKNVDHIDIERKIANTKIEVFVCISSFLQLVEEFLWQKKSPARLMINDKSETG